jgi:hypothetical protein
MQIIGLGMLILNYQYLIYEQYQTIFNRHCLLGSIMRYDYFKLFISSKIYILH